MKWIIDADPGIDDVAAIAAMLRGGAEVLGITAVHGNTSLRHTSRNARRVVEMLGADVPVYAGADQALLEPPRRAAHVHGEDGFGNLSLPEPIRPLAPGHAVDFIIESAARYAGDLSLLAIGPLTNVALAIAKDRSLVQKVRRIVCMGGTSDARGNTTVVSEFNIHADPEAAAIVLESGIPVTLVPWETTLNCIIGPEDLQRLERSDKPAARLFSQAMQGLVHLLEERLGSRGVVLCDLVAAAVALDPAAMTQSAAAHVTVETAGRIARGLTAVDYLGLSEDEPSVTVCLAADQRRVAELLLRSFTA
ncbi:MAG: nucleoside hydrolase [Symbiobacteriia bacterium]